MKAHHSLDRTPLFFQARLRAELEMHRQALTNEFENEKQRLATQQVKNVLSLEKTEAASLEVRFARGVL